MKLFLLFRKLVLLTFIALFLSSCEYAYNYTYTVKNSADTTIEIHMKTYRVDSVYNLAKGEERTLYKTEHGVEPWSGPYFDDVDHDLHFFSVKKRSVQSSRDYLKNSSWSFEKEGRIEGKYKTTVTSAEF